MFEKRDSCTYFVFVMGINFVARFLALHVDRAGAGFFNERNQPNEASGGLALESCGVAWLGLVRGGI